MLELSQGTKNKFGFNDETYSLEEYLNLCKKDKSVYATSAERILNAIGEPELVDTSKDERLSRIFLNRKIKVYPAFKDFYGMEDAIQNIVSFFKHAAQGLEESKQVLYLLGPVGGGKSSIAERLKKIAEKEPIYVLEMYNKSRGEFELSPCYESPLGLFDGEDAENISKKYKIPTRYMDVIPSPWAVKRLKESGVDISEVRVKKIYPNSMNQVGITKVEPGDENNQDISSLVGKVNIPDLDTYGQNDPDAYSWSGGLNIATQGVVDFVEMFKAPIKMLHPLLTATQEGHYNGTEQFGAIPFQGIILAHSNESEWQTFRANKNNEAFLDRVNIVKVPYCLRVQEEELIYKKLISGSDLSTAPCAPGTTKMMAEFSVLSRLKVPDNSTLYSKMKIYDGKNLKNKDPNAKSLEEYQDVAGVNEGMSGSSTRFAFKILSKVFNYNPEEIGANPIHLMHVLEKELKQEGMSETEEADRIGYIKDILAVNYAKFVHKQLQEAYLESYYEYGATLFERYVNFADFWLQDKEYRDADTGESFDREALNAELEKIEKPAGIVNPKDFRNETSSWVMRYKANHNGDSPDWRSYEKLREVIEAKMFANTEELLPIISFTKKSTSEEDKKHTAFVERMTEKGYTTSQVKLLVDWFLRYQSNN